MKAIIKMASATIESNGEVRIIKAIDYEEVDGWVASVRAADGEWTRWMRADGFSVARFGRDGKAKPWRAGRAAEGWLTNAGTSMPRAWKTAEAARRAIDREYPLRALSTSRAVT